MEQPVATPATLKTGLGPDLASPTAPVACATERELERHDGAAARFTVGESQLVADGARFNPGVVAERLADAVHQSTDRREVDGDFVAKTVVGDVRAARCVAHRENRIVAEGIASHS